ncbi:MAG: FGGY family carbohydrate kinase [Steroidobacteraceae bacterium]
MSRGVLALDQGSHASRACLFDESGALLATATVPVATVRRGAAEVEQDADELVDSLRVAAIEAVAQARAARPGLQLVAAGLAVQRSTIVCCAREDGHVLSPALSWQDHRNAAWLQLLQPQAARIRELTGLPLSAHYGASKLRWCLEHLPEVARAASAGALLAAPLASFLAMKLSAGDARSARVDAANASRMLLLDSRQLDWSPELLALFGIDRAWLPSHAPTSGDWGVLSLPDCELPLRAVTGDQSAVPWSEGDANPGIVYVNLGTGAFIQRPLLARPHSPAPLLGSVLYRDLASAIYSLEGTVNGAGAAVSWFCEQHRCAEHPLWAALDALDARVALPVFVNGIGGLGSPWWRSTMASTFIDGNDNPLLGFAAVIESVAFMIAANAALLVRQSGAPQRVLLAGGMSRSQWLCRKLASLLELPVQVTAAEASARGVARLAAPELTEQWPDAPIQTWEPRPDAALRARYARFLDAIGS